MPLSHSIHHLVQFQSKAEPVSKLLSAPRISLLPAYNQSYSYMSHLSHLYAVDSPVQMTSHCVTMSKGNTSFPKRILFSSSPVPPSNPPSSDTTQLSLGDSDGDCDLSSAVSFSSCCFASTYSVCSDSYDCERSWYFPSSSCNRASTYFTCFSLRLRNAR